MYLPDAFIQETYSAFSLYICLYVSSLGIEHTTFCAANEMLYHWATGKHFYVPTCTLSFFITTCMMV